ncbi:MAG TPA: thioesterase family protein [Actinomycetota bacterium]|nr:thioesterase family protein [Actinomycetota bacterium]
MRMPSAEDRASTSDALNASTHARITVQRRIEWSDTDASGYWHNTAAFRWIEVAETALLQGLGIMEEIYGRMPRVRISAEFRKGLRHKDLVDIELAIAEVRRSSVTYVFRMTSDGTVAAEGTAVAVLLDRAGGRPVPWPDEYRRLLLESGSQPGERLITEGSRTEGPHQ